MGNFTGILAEMETIIGTVATLKLVSEEAERKSSSLKILLKNV